MHYAVGLISDTHGVFDRAAAETLKHTDLVIHAGDVGHHGRHREVLQLYAEATDTQLLAVAGNVDDQLDAADRQLLPQHRLVQVAGWKLLVCHIVASGPTAQVDTAAAALIQQLQPDIVVFGHSHKACCWQAGGVCYINPGSAGPARFKLPRTVALLELPYKTSATAAGHGSQPAGATDARAGNEPAPRLQAATGMCAPAAVVATTSSRSSREFNARAARVLRSKGGMDGRTSAEQRKAMCSSASGYQGGTGAAAAAAGGREGGGRSDSIPSDAWLGELHVRFVQLPQRAPPRLAACT